MQNCFRQLFLSVCLVFFGVEAIFSQCPVILVPSQTNNQCAGQAAGSAAVSASGGTVPYTYNWSTGATTSAVSNLPAGTYSVIVNDSSCVPSGTELVVNGDFSAGATGFTSTYTVCVPNCSEGSYAVGTNPNAVHTSWCACGDHTTGTGNFMILNGSAVPGTTVWCQTIPIAANTNYQFSAWVVSQYTVSPSQLQFSINGVNLGAVFTAPSTCCTWQQFFVTWNSGASTSATICIENMNTVLGGNDFGLDDISFQACYPCSDTATVTITEPLPLSLTGNTTNEFCNRADGMATINVSGGTGAYTYSWNPSVQTTSAITGLTAGNYSVTVTDASGCTHDTVLTVNFTAGPTASAGADATICSGNSTQLNGSGGGTYLWSPAAGLSNVSVANPVAGPTTTTTYSVTVTDGNGCTSTDDATVIVYPTPVASFSVTTVCFNNPTLFTDLSTGGNIVQWSWSFGDGNTDSVQNPSHTYNTYGAFVVLLIVTTAEGCQDTTGMQVNVHPLPSGSFSSTTVCVGDPTCFNDLSTLASGSLIAWSWNFDDPSTGTNNISNMQNPCHIFSDTGSYNVVLTVTSNYSCQTTVILPAVVLPPPVAAFAAPDVCLNTPTVFTDASTSALTWSWSFGDGGTSNQQNPSHTYLGYGTYIVTLIVSSTGSCADTVIDTVVVNPNPVVNFTADTVCQGDSTTFGDLSFISSGNISGWLWSFGDGDTSLLQNPQHLYASAGSYNVTLSVFSNTGCTTAVSQQVVVHPLPVANFAFTPAPIAQLIDPVEFTDLTTGNVVSWFWNFGDGDTSTLQFPSHLYSDTGAYVITLIVTSNYGCMDTIQYPLLVRDYVFYIPNTFTPNGDDKNDFFFAVGLGILEYELSIFDRWGNLIFYCKVNDLPQSLPCRWNGKVKGGGNYIVQEDVYVYKVAYTNIFKDQYTLIGNLNVIR